jgi:rhamnosyltransferase
MTDSRVAAADFWGMVMSAQRGDHVQSWFFAMRRPVIESPAFREFWESVEPQSSKEKVIDHYEIGLTEAFAGAGFRAAAIYDGRRDRPPTFRERCHNVSPLRLGLFGRHRRRVARMGPPFNPSELFWERACDAGVPYLKAAIFRANPYRVDVRRVLARAVNRWPEWATLIHNHLTRVGMAVES